MALILGACSFAPGQFTGDAGDDQPATVTVKFAAATTLADENSATLAIHVTLSGPAEEAVTVAYAISGGTATKDADYTASDGTLTFAPGDIDETIDVTIKADGEVESDETIELALSSPTGATLGLASHVITISANTLPRVSFMTPTSMSAEDASTTLVVALDTTPLVPVTVDLVGSGTATGGGTDYTLSTTTLTFDAGTTTLTQTVDLTVNNDLLDENDEDAIIDFANNVNVIVASTNETRTHNIQDNDDPPHVTFALGPASSVGEGTAMVDLSVTLDAPSGKDISIDFSVDGASSATGGGTDFTLGTASPLMFPAGMTTKTIRVNINNDATIEFAETVVITLDNLGANPNVQAGTDTTHTLTITDNDGTCVGSGAYSACFATLSGTTNISAGTINTDTDGRCVSPAAGWTGQPASCFITGNNIMVNGVITVTGSKPLVLLAGNNLSIGSNIDASSNQAGGRVGAAANSSLCTAYSDTPNNGNTGNGRGGGGGAGASFRSAGGNGGNGGVGNTSGGGATAAVGAPTALRGGCAGQKGADYGGNGGGTGGDGGGALYLAAGNQLSISSGVFVNVSGAGGDGGGDRTGGGGGGSGGMLELFAASFNVSGAKLIANGGGGASGGDDNSNGADGGDSNTGTITTPAPGATAGTDGGDGFAGTTQAQPGDNFGSDDRWGGGGGGGGGGHIHANGTLTGAVISTGGS